MVITADTELSEILDTNEVNDILMDSENHIGGILYARIGVLEDSISSTFSSITIDGVPIIANNAQKIVNDYYELTDSINQTFNRISEVSLDKELEELEILRDKINKKIEEIEAEIARRKRLFEEVYTQDSKYANSVNYTTAVRNLRRDIMNYENKLLQISARISGADVILLNPETYDLNQDLSQEAIDMTEERERNGDINHGNGFSGDYPPQGGGGTTDGGGAGRSFNNKYSAYDCIGSGYIYGADEARAYLSSLGYSRDDIEKAIEMARDNGRIDITKDNKGVYPEPAPNPAPSPAPTPAPTPTLPSPEELGVESNQAQNQPTQFYYGMPDSELPPVEPGETWVDYTDRLTQNNAAPESTPNPTPTPTPAPTPEPTLPSPEELGF